MPLNLPKVATLKPAMAYSVGTTLMSVVAYRPAALTTYQFYEELDNWLGPWGVNGYPIGYGKKYNIAFGTDPILNSSHFPVSKQWVRQTTINLQLALVDLIVAAIRTNTLSGITQEPKLRKAAFDSHPGAYLRGGLMQVAQEEPECIPVIAMIPWEQFNPANPNFVATFRQIVEVIREPGIHKWLLAAMVGTSNLPRECQRLLYEVSQEAAQSTLRRAQENIAAAKRAVVNEAKRAVLRQFADLVERYQPLRRYFY